MHGDVFFSQTERFVRKNIGRIMPPAALERGKSKTGSVEGVS